MNRVVPALALLAVALAPIADAEEEVTVVEVHPCTEMNTPAAVIFGRRFEDRLFIHPGAVPDPAPAPVLLERNP